MKLSYKSSAEEKIQTHGATFRTVKICRETVEIIYLYCWDIIRIRLPSSAICFVFRLGGEHPSFGIRADYEDV